MDPACDTKRGDHRDYEFFMIMILSATVDYASCTFDTRAEPQGMGGWLQDCADCLSE